VGQETLNFGWPFSALDEKGAIMRRSLAARRTSDTKDAKTIAETARLRSDLLTITSPDQVVTDLRCSPRSART
jgi:hypothetical protein